MSAALTRSIGNGVPCVVSFTRRALPRVQPARAASCSALVLASAKASSRAVA